MRCAILGACAAFGSPALADCELGRAAGADGREQVLTLAEAADFFRVDPASLSEAAARGEVPGRRVAGEWRFFRGALTAWLAGSDEPADCFDAAVEPPAPQGSFALASASGYRLSRQEMAAAVGRNVAPPSGAAPVGVPAPPSGGGAGPSGPPLPPDVAPGPDGFGEAPERESALDVSLRREAILTPKGGFSAELDLFYVRRDQNLSSLTPFGMTVADRRMQTFGANLTGRYGLRDDLELILALPWIRRTEKLAVTQPETTLTVAESSDTSFEDVRLGLQYAALAEGPGRPGVVVMAEGRVPVDGSSAYALGGNVSLVKSFDPATLFGSLGYLHTFNADTLDVDELTPEHSVVGVAGFAFAMNDRLSLSAALTGTFTPSDELGEFTLASDQDYDLRLALTSLLGENLYVEPSVTVGLNGPDDLVAFGLSIPYVFGPGSAASR